MRIIPFTVFGLVLLCLGTSVVVADESVETADIPCDDFCEIWVGRIKLMGPGDKSHTLLEETKTIPLILPAQDPTIEWGFALACEDPDKRCAVDYAVYVPVDNWSSKTEVKPALFREIWTPPGGVVRPFGFDPGDFYGTYRLVVELEGRKVCDTKINVVE